MISLILGEYLRNLKERNELDALLLLLLEQMKFQVIKSAQSSHGQPEYGNDITAMKSDKKGESTLYIFQIKAGNDADITSKSFNKEDGVRESLLQAIDVDFQDSSIPGLNGSKKKIVLVHNGELKANFRTQFEGFINKETESRKIEFERWDIFKLTDLFSKYLFNEYLFSNTNYIHLLKKTLAFIDVPEYDFKHFKELVDGMLNDSKEYRKKSFERFMATYRMIATMIVFYAEEAGNLEPSKHCITYMLLKTWGWILENKVEKKKNVKTEFFKLNLLHNTMMEKYFFKTVPIAIKKDGFFSENGGPFEIIGYPIRSLEYIGYFVYQVQFYQQYPYLFKALLSRDKNTSENHASNLQEYLLNILITIIKNNSGCSRPLLDNHSIPIVLILISLYKKGKVEDSKKYLTEVFRNVSIIKSIKKCLPELYNNLDALLEFGATNSKPDSYKDSSSYLIKTLFEFVVLLEEKCLYDKYWEYFMESTKLLTYLPPEDIVENENLLFQKELGSELKTDLFLPAYVGDQNESLSFEEFSEKVKNYPAEDYNYRTDRVGFSHIRILAHVFFKNPIFPGEWRKLLQKREHETK